MKLVTAALEDGIHIVKVNLGNRSYAIYIAPGIMDRAGQLIKRHLTSIQRYAIITSPEIYSIHGGALCKSLDDTGIEPSLIFVPDGEESKTWDEAGRVIGELVDLGIDKRSTIIALGGGVVGDLAGFVSAIYLRGVRFVQLPTTLLAQVDSSIGGKTAVNHTKGKNLMGAFHQPSLVLSDPNTLKTLPREELVSGLAEAVKYAVIANTKLFNALEANIDKLVGCDISTLSELIARCCEIKARFVELDERDDKDLRAALNYGHTVGHAVEILSGLEIRHGEAVAIGMSVAARLASSMGMLDPAELDRQEALLKRIGLPTELPQRMDDKTLLEIMHRDKKVLDGSIRFVLPTGIGDPTTIRSVPEKLILRALEDSRREA